MVLLTGNLIFVEMNSDRTFCNKTEPKFMAGSISGVMMPGEIYSKAEILAVFPNIIEVPGFKEMIEAYNKK